MTSILLKAVINFQSSSYSSCQYYFIQSISFSCIVCLFFPLGNPNLLVFLLIHWLFIFSLLCWFIFSPLNSNCYTSVCQHLPFYVGANFLDDLYCDFCIDESLILYLQIGSSMNSIVLHLDTYSTIKLDFQKKP